jgi:hypothetical protein
MDFLAERTQFARQSFSNAPAKMHEFLFHKHAKSTAKSGQIDEAIGGY